MLSTTIKKVWMDKILSGEKKVEYKGATDYWKKRICWPNCPTEINFLCGQKSYRYKIPRIVQCVDALHPKDIDGVLFSEWYEIELGERVR